MMGVPKSEPNTPPLLMVTVRLIRDKSLRRSTWRNSGTCRLCLSVRITTTAWARRRRDMQLRLTSTREVTLFQEFMLMEWTFLLYERPPGLPPSTAKRTVLSYMKSPPTDTMDTPCQILEPATGRVTKRRRFDRRVTPSQDSGTGLWAPVLQKCQNSRQSRPRYVKTLTLM